MIDTIVIENTATSELVVISTDSRTIVLDEIDWDSPSVTMSNYRVPFQIGQTISGLMISTRTPTIYGYVVADTYNMITAGMTWDEYYTKQKEQIDDTKQKLDKLLSVYQDVRISANGYYLDARPTQPIKYSTETQDNNTVLCRFEISLECFAPMFYQTSKIIRLALVDGMFIFPWVIPSDTKFVFGEIMQQQSLTIENGGDIPVGCIIRIIAKGGEVKDPKIYNVNTGEYIGFTGVNMDDGDYITINTRIGEENAILHKIADSSNTQLIGNLSNGSKFLQIEQGTRYYAYQVDELYKNNVEVSIEYTEQYFNIRGM